METKVYDLKNNTECAIMLRYRKKQCLKTTTVGFGSTWFH